PLCGDRPLPNTDTIGQILYGLKEWVLPRSARNTAGCRPEDRVLRARDAVSHLQPVIVALIGGADGRQKCLLPLGQPAEIEDAAIKGDVALHDSGPPLATADCLITIRQQQVTVATRCVAVRTESR